MTMHLHFFYAMLRVWTGLVFTMLRMVTLLMLKALDIFLSCDKTWRSVLLHSTHTHSHIMFLFLAVFSQAFVSNLLAVLVCSEPPSISMTTRWDPHLDYLPNPMGKHGLGLAIPSVCVYKCDAAEVLHLLLTVVLISLIVLVRNHAPVYVLCNNQLVILT